MNTQNLCWYRIFLWHHIILIYQQQLISLITQHWFLNLTWISVGSTNPCSASALSMGLGMPNPFHADILSSNSDASLFLSTSTSDDSVSSLWIACTSTDFSMTFFFFCLLLWLSFLLLEDGCLKSPFLLVLVSWMSPSMDWVQMLFPTFCW